MSLFQTLENLIVRFFTFVFVTMYDSEHEELFDKILREEIGKKKSLVFGLTLALGLAIIFNLAMLLHFCFGRRKKEQDKDN